MRPILPIAGAYQSIGGNACIDIAPPEHLQGNRTDGRGTANLNDRPVMGHVAAILRERRSVFRRYDQAFDLHMSDEIAPAVAGHEMQITR